MSEFDPIDEALVGFPHELLDPKAFRLPGRFGAPEVPSDATADVAEAWRWIEDHVGPVLEAVGRNTKAAVVFARMLPKPWMYRVDFKPDLTGLSKQDRAEWKRVKAERKKIFKDMGQDPGVVPKLPRWPKAVQSAIAVADAKKDEQRKKWDEAFFGEPAVWLWALWESWTRLTGMPAIPGVPKWPGIERLLQKDNGGLPANLFLITMRFGLGLRINRNPGEAANFLRRGIEDLRERLAEADLAARVAGGLAKRPKSVEKVAEALKNLRDQRQPYTSQRKLGESVGCSPATVAKAIKTNSDLWPWQQVAKNAKARPRAQSLTDLVVDSTPRPGRTPDEEAELGELIVEQKDERYIEEKAPKGNRLLGRQP